MNDIDNKDELDINTANDIDDIFAQISTIKQNPVQEQEDETDETDEIEEEKKEEEQELETEEESEEQEEETQEDLAEEKKSSEKKEPKYWKERKRKFKVLMERNEALKENDKLKEMLQVALDSGAYHFNKNMHIELENAKNIKKQAMEAGDFNAMQEADINIHKTLNTINEFEKWNNQKRENETVPFNDEAYESNYYDPQTEKEIIQDWFDDHPYLNPRSNNYNANLATQVAKYTVQLDSNLTATNQRNKILSPEYLDAVENYIEQIKQNSQRITKNVESVHHVGGVRNSYSTSSIGSRKTPRSSVDLTDMEREFASSLNMSEKEFRKLKLIEQQNQQRERKYV